MEKIKKIVLAYSGGLDTSVILHWLKEKYKAEVIAFTADLGQGGDSLEKIKKKAERTGASKAYVKDLQEEFVLDYVFPTLKADALYQGKYPLATALARPLIAKELVNIAEIEGADAIAHGCTGKGNDQVRFEVTARAMNPQIKILAPVREWEFTSRDEEIEYANVHNIPLEAKEGRTYSIDRNLWGISVECGPLEDAWQEPLDDSFQIVTNPEKSPSKPTYLEIEFEQGTPVKLNGEKHSPVKLIQILNEIGGENGVGRIDVIEDRLVGIKSREIYEAPAALILYQAHRELESLTLDKDVLQFKPVVSNRYAELVYNGLWQSPLREALDKFTEETQKWVTGLVRVKLFKGSCQVVGRKSPVSLYDVKLATYTKEDVFDQKAAPGFIHLWGLPLTTSTKIRKKK